jgi:hypothetical protein
VIICEALYGLFAAISSSWSVVFFILAALGGEIVFLGLWIEKEADEEDKKEHLSNFTPEKARIKLKSEFGWYILMIGIAFEVLIATGSAIREDLEIRQANPWNGKILEISARAFIIVKDDSATDLVWGSPSRVASLTLCENTLEAKVGASHFFPLSAEKFNRSGFVMIGGDTIRKRGYSMTFQSEGMEAFSLSPEQPVKDIDTIKIIRIDLKFLPKNSEILNGKIQIIINRSIIGDFQILPQIDTNAADGVPNFPYAIFATNGVWTPKK